MYKQDMLCEISKVTFEIPHKTSYPYHERCVVCLVKKIVELQGLQARKRFWNTPEMPYNHRPQQPFNCNQRSRKPTMQLICYVTDIDPCHV